MIYTFSNIPSFHYPVAIDDGNSAGGTDLALKTRFSMLEYFVYFFMAQFRMSPS